MTKTHLTPTQMLRVQEVATGAPAPLALQLATTLKAANLKTGIRKMAPVEATLPAGSHFHPTKIAGVAKLTGDHPFKTRPVKYGMTPFIGPKGFQK